jgi:hypothetical protein
MGLSELKLLPCRGLVTEDQLDSLADHLDELIIILAHLNEKFDFVFGDKLQPVNVVAELIELSQHRVKGALVASQQRGGNAVELSSGVVLGLPV